MQRLIDADAVHRLQERDPTLFTSEVDQRQAVMRRLGWTDLADKAPGRLPLLTQLTQALIQEGATDVVLLGMGGSSLAPLVFERVVGSAPGHPRLHVLDTTDPGAVKPLLDSLQPVSTYFLVSSKSGGTIEPLSLYAIFREWADAALERIPAGKHFIVVTDPGSDLDKLRQKTAMRTTLSGVPTVGGRYSALSMFGLAPAALIGVDLATVIERARVMEDACFGPVETSPAAALAAWMVDAAEAGRDKLTLACSRELAPFGLWVEQLVAESLGKQGRGIVPVLEPLPSIPTGLGHDRAVVVFRLAADTALAEWREAAEFDAPTLEIVAEDVLDIGAEFVRWEAAVALAGALMGVNPFDEPNVTEAKQATSALLGGGLPVPPATCDFDGIWVTYAGATPAPGTPAADLGAALVPLLASAGPGDYLTVLAYLPENDTLLGHLQQALKRWSTLTGVAACLELGPRYLHSTGQLHKGGPDTGLFLMVTNRERTDLPVPGKPFTLGALFRAQAEGDLATLAGHGKRVVRVDLPDHESATVYRLASAIAPAGPVL